MVLQNRAYVNQRLSALNDAADGGFVGLVFSHELYNNSALLLSVEGREKYITNSSLYVNKHASRLFRVLKSKPTSL